MKKEQSFALYFSVGGSIQGYTFEVDIDQKGHLIFRQSLNAGQDEIKKFEYNLTAEQYDNLTLFIRDNNFINLSSQDFNIDPLAEDQGVYHLKLGVNKVACEVRCGMPPPYGPAGRAESTILCQQKLKALSEKLGTVVGIKIY